MQVIGLSTEDSTNFLPTVQFQFKERKVRKLFGILVMLIQIFWGQGVAWTGNGFIVIRSHDTKEFFEAVQFSNSIE